MEVFVGKAAIHNVFGRSNERTSVVVKHKVTFTHVLRLDCSMWHMHMMMMHACCNCMLILFFAQYISATQSSSLYSLFQSKITESDSESKDVGQIFFFTFLLLFLAIFVYYGRL